MSLVTWLALEVSIVGVIAVARFVRGRASSNRLDAGSVSDQWIAEHRASQNNGSRR